MQKYSGLAMQNRGLFGRQNTLESHLKVIMPNYSLVNMIHQIGYNSDIMHLLYLSGVHFKIGIHHKQCLWAIDNMQEI